MFVTRISAGYLSCVRFWHAASMLLFFTSSPFLIIPDGVLLSFFSRPRARQGKTSIISRRLLYKRHTGFFTRGYQQHSIVHLCLILTSTSRTREPCQLQENLRRESQEERRTLTPLRGLCPRTCSLPTKTETLCGPRTQA